MKKLLCMLTAILLLTVSFACAEEFPKNEFVRLQDGDEVVMWWSDEPIVINFGGLPNSDEYTLQVGGAEAVTDKIYTTYGPELYAVSYDSELFLFVGGAGDSGDSWYHVYEYQELWIDHGGTELLFAMPGKFTCASDPEDFEAGKHNLMTADVWSDVLGTRLHEQEFVIASNSIEHARNPDVPYLAGVFRLPKGLYPAGTVVTVLQDLPLLTERDTDAEQVVLPKGSYAVVVGFDEGSWGYIAAINENGRDEKNAGWIKLAHDTYDGMIIDGQEVSYLDYLDGIRFSG